MQPFCRYKGNAGQSLKQRCVKVVRFVRGGFIQVTYFICVTYCHLACLKRHSIVCEWLLNLLRWLQVVPCSHNYELFAVNDNSKTAKYDMIHAYLCSRPTSVGQDQGSHHTTNFETYCSSLWQNEISHAF